MPGVAGLPQSKLRLLDQCRDLSNRFVGHGIHKPCPIGELCRRDFESSADATQGKYPVTCGERQWLDQSQVITRCDSLEDYPDCYRPIGCDVACNDER